MHHRRGCNVRQKCREGVLAQAVRDIRRGIPRNRVREILLRKVAEATEEQVDQIIDLAYRAVWAANVIMLLGPDDAIPPGTIPRLPP